MSSYGKGKVPNQSNARQSSGMSCTRQTLRQSGKMSGAHGCTSGDKSKGLYGTQNRVGNDCRTFHKSDYKQGPRKLS